MTKKLNLVLALLTLSAFVAAAGCGGAKDEPSDTPANGGKAKFAPKGDEGTIAGKIAFEGTPPAAKRIDMGQDANCASAPGDKMTDDVVVTDGNLGAVFVYVKGGDLDKYTFEVPTDSAHLDQLGCRYVPRVLGAQTGQVIRITNSDPTTHNIHPTPKNNPNWNKSQAKGAPPIEEKFTRAETLIPVKCDQHPWMRANIGVLAHPYFAVSAADGTYEIKNLPPGTYTLVAWHETFGEQTESITVGASESKSQDFTYRAGQAYAPTSLRVEPALIVPYR